MRGATEDETAVQFIVMALQAGWTFDDTDRRVKEQFPDIVGPRLMGVYNTARDHLRRSDWLYPHVWHRLDRGSRTDPNR